MKKFSLMILALALSSMADMFIRYNYLGYSPSRQKRLVVMSDEETEGKEWRLINRKSGIVVEEGELDRGAIPAGDHLPLEFNTVLDLTNLRTIGDYALYVEDADTAYFPIAKDPYGSLIQEPLHWMRAARCGTDEAFDHGFCHGGDTACVILHREGMDNNIWNESKASKKGKRIDGSGGWHDAGDYLKFSHTIGYSAYFLLRAYDINPELFDTLREYSTSEFNDLLDEAKWGLDWLLKSMPDTNEFIIMVGDAEDHNIGHRMPEKDQLDGKRPIFSALSPAQMGYTAAALALGARIFGEKGYGDMSVQYREMAELIYRRARSDDAVPGAWYIDHISPFYNDETQFDNLEMAATELYKLTGNDFYLKEAISHSDMSQESGWRSWANVHLPAHVGLMDYFPIASNYLFKDLDKFLQNSREPGNIWGLPTKYVWGGLYVYIGIGAAALEYQLKTGDRRYEELGRNMIDYMLGYNNWGICFVATEDVPNSITDPYSQIYRLQSKKFPRGAISEGPGDVPSWDYYRIYFSFDETMERTHRFNTSKGVFYDNYKDFMCMETTITGVVDGIVMLAVASKLYND